MSENTIQPPYLLFMGDAPDELAAKSARGVYEWRPELCVGQLCLEGCKAGVDLPNMTVAEAAAAGAKTFVLGVTNRGGVVSDEWRSILVDALDNGLDIVSGLHTRIDEIDVVREAAVRNGQTIHEVRHPHGPFNIATGKPRSGQRILAVGTDCSVGKMYTMLALEKSMKARGLDAKFRATGQTGIMIDGGGVPVDAVVADFIAGVVEDLAPAADDSHWDCIEGQGSLFHPSYAGVSLGLMHGAQPTALIMCHEPTRTHMRGLPHQSLPSIDDCIKTNLAAARVVSPDVVMAGISVNTKDMSEDAAQKLLADLAQTHALPCVDPGRNNIEPIVDALVSG